MTALQAARRDYRDAAAAYALEHATTGTVSAHTLRTWTDARDRYLGVADDTE